MKDRILVILPTMNRSGLFDIWAQSWLATTEGLSDVVVAVDEGDMAYEDLKVKYPQFIWETLPPAKPLVQLNRMALKYSDEYRWLGFMEDDCVYRATDWESTFVTKLNEMGHNGIVYPSDTLNHGPSLITVSLPVMDSSIVKRLGFMSPPGLQCVFPDNFWTVLARDLGMNGFLQHILIRHDHYSTGRSAEDETARAQSPFFPLDQNRYHEYMLADYNTDLAKLL